MSLTIGQAGLDAAMRRMDAAAWGIARASGASAPPAEPAAADAGPPGGVPPPGGAAPALQAATEAASSRGSAPGDLAAQMIGLMTASQAVMANLQTIRRTDEAMRRLIESS